MIAVPAALLPVACSDARAMSEAAHRSPERCCGPATMQYGACGKLCAAGEPPRAKCWLPAARLAELSLAFAALASLLGYAAAAPHEPTVTDVSPINGPTTGGTILTISGANFGTGEQDVQPQVSVGGAPCQQVVWVSSTSILCESPDGVGGHKPVAVSVNGVTSAPDQDAEFNYNPPSVQAIEPGHGAASGGTMVTIIGDNFGATNNNPSVTIGGRPCMSVVWLSNSKLKCVSPAGIGIGDVRVFILDESSPENFGTIFEFDAPLVTGVDPDHGPSTGGLTVTVLGTNFGTVDSKPQIKVGNHNCLSTQWQSNGAVLCVVPPGQGLSKDIQVEILGQPSKSAEGDTRFSYDGPQVTALVPPNGPAIGGSQVTVFGSNFGSKDEGYKIAVRIGEVPCSSQTWVSQSCVTCVSPSGTGEKREVQVQVIGEKSAPCTDKQMRHELCPSLFRYDAPVVLSVDPPHGPTTGGYYVNIPGDNYGTAPSALKITMGKEECEKTNWVSNTMAQCLVPAGVGEEHVVVVVDGQQSSEEDEPRASAAVFTYDAPVLVRVLPSAGNPAGGQLVTLEGSNFGTDKSKVEVLVGNLPGKVVSVREDRVLMVMPQGEGQRAITVRVASIASSAGSPGAPQHAGAQEIKPDVSGAVPVDDYEYKGPVVTAVTPAHGVTQGGNHITVFGRDFGGSGTPVTIKIGGFDCIESKWVSGTASTCSTPPGSGGNKDVTIVVDGKYRAASPAGYHFSYSAPYVRSVTPNTGALDGGTRVVVQGLNFGLTDSHPVAYVGPTRCSATEWTDDAAVTCVTPAWGSGPTVNPVTVRVDGQTSAENLASAFQYGNRGSPVITALAWTRAPTDGGFTITLFGSKFEDNHAEAFIGRYVTTEAVAISVADKQDNGNAVGGPAGPQKPQPMGRCRATTWVSESKVLCIAPAGVGTHLPVAVKMRDFPEAETFGSLFFEYDPPVVTGVSSTHGSIAGGLEMTVTGYGFGLGNTFPAVKVGPTRCEHESWISDSSMRCTTPAGQGEQSVAVKVGGQWSSTTKNLAPLFIYEGSAITAISPASAAASGGSVMTLYGNDFADNDHPMDHTLDIKIITPVNVMARVLPSGAASTAKGAEKACTNAQWISHTAVECTVPSGVGAALDVQVLLGPSQMPTEVYRGFGLFSYAAPAVTSVTPTVGNSAGGLPVTVTGTNFGVVDYEPRAFVGDTPCSRTLFVSDDRLVCVTPAGGGTVGVSVKVGNQRGTPLPSAFRYAVPFITRVYPDSGPMSGNTQVTIVGNNFGRSAASVPKAYIGKHACAKTRWISNMMVVCYTPRGSDLVYRHFVTVNVEGMFTPAHNSARFIYVEPPGGARGFTTHEDGRLRSGKLSATGRAPGIYLSIAYLVAFAIIVATVFILRVLLFRKANAQRRSVRKVQRGFFGRITNKIFGRIFRENDGREGTSEYHIVDSIDIEMEASSEIDVVEHLRPIGQ